MNPLLKNSACNPNHTDLYCSEFVNFDSFYVSGQLSKYIWFDKTDAVGYNYGDIHSTGAYADVISDGIAGGVIGSSSSESDVILGCYHIGTVSGKERAGGVCGYAEQSVIVGCYHKGTVEGEGATGAIVGGKTFSSSMVNYWEDDTATTANGVDNENATEVTDGDWLAILSQFNAEIDNTSYNLLEYFESERFEAMPFNSRVQVVVSGGNKK